MDATRMLAAEYSAKVASYATHWSPVIRPMALPLLATLPLRTATRILDVGAGTGALLADLQEAAPEAKVFGVDRAEGMLRAAQRSGSQRLAVMDAEHLGIGSRTVDVVVLIFVLFHLPEPTRGLRELYRVLRDGGVVGVVTWGRDPGSPGLSIWREELDQEGAAADPRDPRVMQQGSMDTIAKLKRLLTGAGFVSVTTWSREVAHQWTLDDLVTVQAGCGMPARRLATLSPERRHRCESRVRARLTHLTQAELEYHAEVLFAVGQPA